MRTKNIIKPISVCWLVTAKCNYNCPFCFKQSSKRELYFNEAVKILGKLAKANVKKISFSGGEPLLWPGIVNLIKKAKSLGIITMLITNGSFLTKEKTRSLEGKLDWLTLPLDGSNEEVQQLVGRPKGHFTRVIKFLEFLQKNKIKLKVNTVACKKNLDDIKNIAKIVKKYNVKRWKVFQFFPIRDAALQHKMEYLIKDQSFEKLKRKIVPLFKDPSRHLYFGSNELLECSYFTIAPDGTIYVSKDGNDYFLGDLKTQSVDEIWGKNTLIDKKKYWERAKWILMDSGGK